MTPSALSDPLKLPLSREDLDAINAHLNLLTPEEILRWAIERIPDLYQTTAFGLTGLVAIDMLSKITKSPPPPIFLDTLYHFPETYKLVDVVKARYNIPVIVYKPEGCATREAFELKYGERFWERDEGGYDYAVKVGKEMIHINDELTLALYIIGRTRQAGVLRVGCKGCDHWAASLSGRSACLTTTARSGRDGVVEAQPTLCVDICVRRLVCQGERRPAQQAVG
jgi:phosphoadenosine phosphosulfate reductase